jgi:hypothetical protein
MFLQSSGSVPRATLFFCLLFGAVGCSRYTRTKQCRALIAQVNPALDDVVTLTHTGGAGGGPAASASAAGLGGIGGVGGTAGAAGQVGTTSAEYIAAAGRYERLAKQLGPMEFSTEDMAKTVAEYASVLTASAQALRTLAAALDAANYPEAERANRDLDRLSVREHAAISHIDAWCQPGT